MLVGINARIEDTVREYWDDCGGGTNSERYALHALLTADWEDRDCSPDVFEDDSYILWY